MTGKERISAGTHGTRLDDGKGQERPFSRWRITGLDSYLLFFRASLCTVQCSYVAFIISRSEKGKAVAGTST
jgi:hypothetical protein